MIRKLQALYGLGRQRMDIGKGRLSDGSVRLTVLDLKQLQMGFLQSLYCDDPQAMS